MGYRKLSDKDDFFDETPGPVKDNNSREKSIGGQIEVTQLPGDGRGGQNYESEEQPDGDAGNRHGSSARYK